MKKALLRSLLLITFALACFALSPAAQAKHPTPTPTPTPTVTPTPTATATPTPNPGEDRGNGNSAAEGVDALNPGTTGANNTAHGWFSLFSNTTGSENTADGNGALFSLTTGIQNTAMGYQALYSATTVSYDTAVGYQALYNETTAESFNPTLNTGIGWHALFSNLYPGNRNTAVGADALESNTTGYQNTATGQQALSDSTGGNANTAIGFYSLRSNTTGSFNTATGASSLSGLGGNSNTAIGYFALVRLDSGDFNTALGTQAGQYIVSGSNNIYIGNVGADESNTIRIGGDTGFGSSQTATYIAGISGTAVVGNTVVVDGNGQLGTIASSQRFKEEIKPMDNASEAILSLRPVTFHYKQQLDPNHTPQFGLVAEEVEKVNPALVSRDAEGKPYTVRYEAVNAMLLNEFLKEHRKVQALEKARADEQNEIAELKQQVKAQAAAIQKVSDQLELSKPAPRTVKNN